MKTTSNPSLYLTTSNVEQIRLNPDNLNLQGLSLLHTFHCVVEKNKNVIHQPRSVRIEKTMPSDLSTQVSWVSKTSGTVFANMDLPAGE